MEKHDKFTWTDPAQETISYEPPKDEYYKAKIALLERENAKLRDDLEKRVKYFDIGKNAYEGHMKELQAENDALRDRVARLEIALVRSEIRDVQV